MELVTETTFVAKTKGWTIQSFPQRLLRGGTGSHHIVGPSGHAVPDAAAASGNVDFLRVINAAIFAGTAVQTALCGAFRSVLPAEMVQRAEALDLYEIGRAHV